MGGCIISESLCRFFSKLRPASRTNPKSTDGVMKGEPKCNCYRSKCPFVEATLGLLETGSMAPKSSEFASTAEKAEKAGFRASRHDDLGHGTRACGDTSMSRQHYILYASGC